MYKAERQSVVEDGVLAGNLYDKYGARNPIAIRLMRGFTVALESFVSQIGAADIHEVGCGEGHLTLALARPGRRVRASDFSSQIVARAEANSGARGGLAAFRVCSIYDLRPEIDAAELVVCCEVLEHLERPQAALEVLSGLARPYLIASVPREPLWRLLNLARGKYLLRGGNTPGHVQAWSRRGFVRFLSSRLDIIRVLAPLPWTMVLCRARSAVR